MKCKVEERGRLQYSKLDKKNDKEVKTVKLTSILFSTDTEHFESFCIENCDVSRENNKK